MLKNPLVSMLLAILQFITDTISALLQRGEAKINLWVHVRREPKAERTLKFVIVTYLLSFLSLGYQTYLFGPYGPTGKVKIIMGHAVSDYTMNALNSLIIPICGLVILAACHIIWQLNRDTNTTAYIHRQAHKNFKK